VAGLAHSGNDDAPLGAADQLDRSDEGLTEPVADSCGERIDPSGFSLQRAQRRFDVRMALARNLSGRIFEVSKVPFGHASSGFVIGL